MHRDGMENRHEHRLVTASRLFYHSAYTVQAKVNAALARASRYEAI